MFHCGSLATGPPFHFTCKLLNAGRVSLVIALKLLLQNDIFFVELIDANLQLHYLLGKFFDQLDSLINLAYLLDLFRKFLVLNH